MRTPSRTDNITREQTGSQHEVGSSATYTAERWWKPASAECPCPTRPWRKVSPTHLLPCQNPGMGKERRELKSIGYEIFIGILSILSIINLVLLYAVQDKSLDTVLTVMNSVFSVIFVADFLYRIFTVPSAGAYFFKHFGWADLLASVPLAQFKILRVFRLLRVYRLLGGVGIHTVGRALIKDRAGSSLYILLLMGILVLEFGSLSILHVEQGSPGANITTASGALWYTIVTISTVGYGDQYPVTNAGRIIGAGIIVVGVGIFGTFTGYLANFFLSPKTKEPAPPTDEADTSTATVEELRLRLDESEARLNEIRKLLDKPTL